MKILGAIPAYNAGASVAAIVRSTRSYLEHVAVVDDGSADQTAAEARAAGATVLTHEKNQGKGAALKTAFAYALKQSCEAIITLDADGQHLASDIPKLIAEFEKSGADLIIGSRRHLFGGMVRRRRMANTFSSWALSASAGAKVDDSQSGFRLYSARLMRTVPLRSTGFDMESEVIVRAARAGMKIVMVPIDLGFVDGLQTSHYKPVRDSLKIFVTAFRTRFLS